LVGSAVLADGAMLGVPALHGPGPLVLPALMAVNFVFGTFGQLVNVTVMSVRQAVTPPVRIQARVVATINFAGMGLTPPFGSLLGGFLAGAWGLRPSLLATAVALALSPAVHGALPPLSRLGRRLPPLTGQGSPSYAGE
ncbi:MFS transporter, partial [Streptomyces sp. SID7803]|nr:MFS transporter [Streptomyces sp. SID7803]